MSVRASPISKVAAILIVVVGVIVLAAGLATGSLANEVAGAAFVALGVVLYNLLFRFAKKLEEEIGEAPRS